MTKKKSWLKNKKNQRIIILTSLILSIIISGIVWYLTGMIVGIILFLLLIIGIIIIQKTITGGKHEADYRAFFILGISFIPLGIATNNYAFTGLGIVYMIIGLKNKSKWKNHNPKKS